MFCGFGALLSSPAPNCTHPHNMFSSSPFSTAMCTASPRAQLHMIHVQERLHTTSQNTPLAQAHWTTRSVAVRDRPQQRAVDIIGCPCQDSRATRRSLSLSNGRRSSDGARLGGRRRSSSGSVSQRRTHGTMNSPSDGRVSQGYDTLTLFGFTRDGALVREAPAAKLSRSVSRASQHLPHDPSKGRPCVRDNQEEDPQLSSISPEQQDFLNMAVVKTMRASTAGVDSLRFVVSEPSVQLDDSCHGPLSDPTVSLVVSDSDDNAEED